MLNKDLDFFRHPGWEEITRQIKYEISQAQRPPDQIILDDIDLCKMLKICKRTAAMLRSTKQIAYHKCGKNFYKLSDVLDYIDRNRVEPDIPQIKSCIK